LRSPTDTGKADIACQTVVRIFGTYTTPAAVSRPRSPCSAMRASSPTLQCCAGAGSATWCWAASNAGLPAAELTRRAAADPFPARGVHGDLAVFVAGARPITDATAELSSVPPPGVFGP
jgi:hypothetical protein